MKKLYLLFLMLLIMFIPGTHSIAIYQLDQPIQELNNHTLREVFDLGNIVINSKFNGSSNWIIYKGGINNGQYVYSSNIAYDVGALQEIDLEIAKYYFVIQAKNSSSQIAYVDISNSVGSTITIDFQDIIYRSSMFEKTVAETRFITLGYFTSSGSMGNVYFDNIKLYNLTSLGISSLTIDQMNMYHNLYLEAVRFELENIEARQDEGGYQNIFKSIIEGVKNLMQEMGNVWNFLNAPIITNDMQNYQPPAVDWSWDIIGVVRQIINNANTLAFQLLFVVPSLIYSLLGIPIHISLLSLLFSNLIFLLLGWIVVKSFII